MAHILHIDSSPRGERSHSRALTQDFMKSWLAVHPNDTVTYRDLGHDPVPHVNEAWIAAAFSPPDTVTPDLAAALDTSDELIAELLAADMYVFGVPMYNLNVPSIFKAYIDQIVRAGHTFAITEQGFKGLLGGKKAVFVTSRGSDFSAGSPFASFDFQEPYLRAIFGFIGVTDMQFINANGLNGGDARDRSLAQAKAAIQAAIV